ncbi:MAG: ABC transporter ATP-binding protein [Hymenobacteraceae bacterium]|mgnify:CR=1 FL=1|nr:ABC transporter ATP-binding protein [Hymenobacteraceae bacterium]MDX5397332.1 ABC transporter ATP-binding protein [Hymenobacteraceae bacterium]MDX5513411.1 ABC transporter ATP-binding protein [Hymenobacteraceae bacterium]
MAKFLPAVAITCLAVLGFNPAQAQTFHEKPELDHVLKYYPTQLGEVHLAYEHVLDTERSNEFGLSYIYKSYANSNTWFGNFEECVGVGFRMSQRNYTTKKHSAPFGFFYGPAGSYKFVLFHENAIPQYRYDSNGNIIGGVGRVTQHSLALQYLIGYHVVPWGRLSLEIVGGLGGRLIVGRARGGEQDLDNFIIGHTLKSDRHTVIKATPAPTLNAAVGWAF